MAEVTLVVTTHDRPKWLRIALTSLLTSAANVKATTRILVMDDGRSRETAAICKRLNVDYRKIAPCSYSEARVAALEDVDSTFLSFVDDDDWFYPYWHQVHFAKMAQEAEVVAASYWVTDTKLNPREATILQPPTLEGLLAGHNPVNDAAWIRTEVLNGVTWHPERDKVMMMSLWLELAAKGTSFAVAEPCWLYRLHGSNMSTAPDEQDAVYRREAIAQWTP